MNIYKLIVLIMLTAAGLLITGCEQEPVFTEMSTSKMKVILKGTLESESTTAAFSIPGVATMADDSVDDYTTTSSDALPTKFMLDVAEFRLNGDKIGNYRQLIEASLSDDENFFNGTGVELKSDDPGKGKYTKVQLYIRKMAFDNAMIYESNGTGYVYDEPAEVIFNENEVEGFNFNNLQTNSYWDSLREDYASVLRVYPLVVPIAGDFEYDSKNEETVLEIRLVIKNFIKMYEYDYYDDGISKVCHFYGLSDWLRDVRNDEQDMGRNLHAVARAYVPGKTGIITGSGATANGYVFAIPHTEPVTDYYISNTGTVLRNAVSNCDFPVAPVYSGTHIESVLDYYVNYEGFVTSWNSKLGTCPDLTTYETAWDGYESSVENFKIAPYVALADSSGVYTFSSVAPGTYDVYYYSVVPAYGALFDDTTGNIIQLGSTVTLSAGETKTP